MLSTFSIPRLVVNPDASHYELHAFCDASEKGYGICAYLLSYINHNVFSSRLLFARSKVAPIHFVSMPKLELSSFHPLAKTFSFYEISIPVKLERIVFYSDTQIALSWIHPIHINLKPLWLTLYSIFL